MATLERNSCKPGKKKPCRKPNCAQKLKKYCWRGKTTLDAMVGVEILKKNVFTLEMQIILGLERQK